MPLKQDYWSCFVISILIGRGGGPGIFCKALRYLRPPVGGGREISMELW